VVDFTSPKESENYKSLLTFISQHEDRGSEIKEALSEILWLTNTPGHLLHFGWITEGLGQLLSACDTLKYASEDTRHWDEAFLYNLKIWVGWHSLHKEELMQIMPEDFTAKPGSNKNPMSRYGLKRFGLYSALFCGQEMEYGRTAWDLLALRFLLAHVRLTRLKWPKNEYESYAGKDEYPFSSLKVYPASKNLRQLSYAKFSEIISRITMDELVGKSRISRVDPSETLGIWMDQQDRAEDRPEPVSSRSNVRRESFASLEEKASPLLNRAIDLLRFLKDAERVDEGEDKHTSNGGKKRGKKQVNALRREHQFGHGYVVIDDYLVVQRIEVDIDDPWAGEEAISLVSEPLGEEGQKERFEILPHLDLHPKEFEDGASLSLVETDCGDTRHNAMSMALAARGRQRQLTIQAQWFRWGYNNLTMAQVKFLDGRLREQISFFAGHERLSDAELLSYECCLLLLVMLWTGSKLSRAVELTIHHKRVFESDSLLGIYAHKDDGGNGELSYEWRFKALEPDYLSNPSFDGKALRERNKSFWLPDAFGVVKHLMDYRECHQQNKKEQKLFLRLQSEYEQPVKAILKNEINKTLIGDGITLHKIENFLFQQIVAEKGDVTAASYITGQGHHASNVTIFYTTPELNVLRSIYKLAIDPIALEIHGAYNTVRIKKTFDTEHVGARHCVRLPGYRQAIDAIKADLRVLSDYSDWKEFVEFHNTYTAYVVFMFGFATAARAIKNPLVVAVNVDEHGLSTLADKDTDPPYHARLIWLPNLVKDQLEDYSRHLSATTQWLFLKHPGRKYEGSDQPCYFITANNYIQPVSPSNLEWFYKKYIDVPANAHRRFLRTELMEEGMPIESLNALMGHWGQGEEPWGPFSSFNVPRHIRCLQIYLEPLISELGFEFISSGLGEEI